ncbi:MAG: hypothetical protein ACM3ME_03240, partial [Chloroflexota bacterium]
MKKMMVAFLFTLLSINLLAQEPEWVQYGSADRIECYAEDDSFMWVGTKCGLVSIDKVTGDRITYNTINSDIPSNDVVGFSVGNETGTVWIATNINGIAKFDGETWTLYNYQNSTIPNNLLYDIAVDSTGMVWFLSHGEGLSGFDGTNCFTYNTDNSNIQSNYLNKL